MKKIAIIIIAVFASLSSFAWKAKTDTTVYAGVWGGASYARIMGYTQTTTPLIRKAFGLQFTYQPTREITLKTGLGFIPKGFVAEVEYWDIYNNSIGFFPTNYSFNYLNVPVTLSYNLGQKKFNIYLSLGLDFDILLKQETYADLPSESNGIEIVNINAINTEQYKSFNFGIHLGGGIEYRIKPNIIAFADVKYMHGLNNVLNVNSIYSLKQRPVVAGIGIRFGIPITYGYYD